MSEMETDTGTLIATPVPSRQGRAGSSVGEVGLVVPLTRDQKLPQPCLFLCDVEHQTVHWGYLVRMTKLVLELSRSI